jgi:hypothetical protein
MLNQKLEDTSMNSSISHNGSHSTAYVEKAIILGSHGS